MHINLTRARLTLCFLLSLGLAGYSQNIAKSPVRFMFYNAGNLFDCADDSLTEDEEFLPEGVRRWNQSRYRQKINSIYKVIVAAGEWEPPQLIGLCEIENRKVLNDLVYGTWLMKYSYGMIHYESPDPRGIDLCLLYRKDLFSVLGSSQWIPGNSYQEQFRTRGVVYIKLRSESDTIHIILNHWPSRRGGVLAGEELRRIIAEEVRGKTDSIWKSEKRPAKVIVAGDFNSTPDDPEVKVLTAAGEEGGGLINLAAVPAGRGEGTYRYMGTWEMIDQVLVSTGLISYGDGIYTSTECFRVFMPEFILARDPSYPGLSPFSTYRGYRYEGGFSDHLPVLLDLRFR